MGKSQSHNPNTFFFAQWLWRFCATAMPGLLPGTISLMIRTGQLPGDYFIKQMATC
jgi:hypothetical protein